MDTFITYLQLGLDHILDINGYDHIMFVIVLSILYTLKEWKPLLVLITAFTIGHSLTLALTVLDLIKFDSSIIEFFIVFSIAITAIINIFRGGKAPNKYGLKLYYFFALFFGLVHGMGFANYLSAILGKSGNIIAPLLGFNIGLELGQIFIVSIILILNFLLNGFFRIKRETTIIVISSIILGVTLPMLMDARFW